MTKKFLAGLSFAVALTILCVAPANGQISLGQVDDFTVASAAGWSEGGASPNPPVHNSGLGLDGIAGHLQNISDGAGSGGRWLMFNDDTRWTGDYLAADVDAIELDFDNQSGNGTDANVRIALNGVGGWFVSDSFLVTDGSGWDTFRFDLLDLSHLSGGSASLTDTLSDVTNFQILSSAATPTIGNGGNPQGDQLVADFRVDNITAVPEPSSLVLLAVSSIGLVVRRRRNQA